MAARTLMATSAAVVPSSPTEAVMCRVRTARRRAGESVNLGVVVTLSKLAAAGRAVVGRGGESRLLPRVERGRHLILR